VRDDSIRHAHDVRISQTVALSETGRARGDAPFVTVPVVPLRAPVGPQSPNRTLPHPSIDPPPGG